MAQCTEKTCKYCTCSRAVYDCVDAVYANSDFEPTPKPRRIVGRDPIDAAKRFVVRFEKSMKILG